MQIIKLGKHKVQQAADVLAASFYDYPMFSLYFPNRQRRTRFLPWYLRNVLNCALRFGEVYTTLETSGIIFLLPPDHTKISLWEYIQCGFFLTPLILGLRNYKRSMDCETYVEDTHEHLMKDRLHFYLWGLAVAPDNQKRGIGEALMRHVLAKTDAHQVPVYLETHMERNIRYYQKYNFELIHATEIPKYGLPIWCMLREPI